MKPQSTKQTQSQSTSKQQVLLCPVSGLAVTLTLQSSGQAWRSPQALFTKGQAIALINKATEDVSKLPGSTLAACILTLNSNLRLLQTHLNAWDANSLLSLIDRKALARLAQFLASSFAQSKKFESAIANKRLPLLNLDTCFQSPYPSQSFYHTLQLWLDFQRDTMDPDLLGTIMRDARYERKQEKAIKATVTTKLSQMAHARALFKECLATQEASEEFSLKLRTLLPNLLSKTCFFDASASFRQQLLGKLKLLKHEKNQALYSFLSLCLPSSDSLEKDIEDGILTQSKREQLQESIASSAQGTKPSLLDILKAKKQGLALSQTQPVQPTQLEEPEEVEEELEAEAKALVFESSLPDEVDSDFDEAEAENLNEETQEEALDKQVSKLLDFLNLAHTDSPDLIYNDGEEEFSYTDCFADSFDEEEPSDEDSSDDKEAGE